MPDRAMWSYSSPSWRATPASPGKQSAWANGKIMENSWWFECICGKLCLYLKLYSFSFPMELLFKLKASETFALSESILNALQEIVDMLEDFCACRSFQPLGLHSDQLCSRLLSAVFVEVLFSLLPFWSLTGFGHGCLGSALQTSIRCQDVTQPFRPL